MASRRRVRSARFQRQLQLEGLERRYLMAVDIDDTISEAVVLGNASTTPRTVNNQIAEDTDVDMYRFTVSTGQTVDFDIDTAFNGPGGLGSYLRLFNSQGQQLAFNNDAAGPGETVVGFDAYLRFTFAFAGTYYIAVSNANNTTYNPVTGEGDTAGGQHSVGSYQLSVQSPVVGGADPDDTLGEAAPLSSITSSPQTVNGQISPDVDVDMFRFSVSAGQTVDFDIDTVTNGPGGLGSFVRLFNSQGVQLASNDDAAAPGESSVGFDSYLRFTFNTAGTYFLGISNANNRSYNPVNGTGDTAGGSHSTGNHSLVVQSLPVDPDDSLVEATSLGTISNTAVRSGAITPDVDVDLYRFTAAAGQTVDFDIDTPTNGPGGLGSYLRLFNSQGQQLAFNNDGAAPGESLGFDSFLRFTFSASGTYYIGVSNFTNNNYNPVNGTGDTAGGPHAVGQYQLIVQSLASDNDDTLPEALSLGSITTTPRAVSGSISPDVDVDLFRFSVSGGQTVDFDIDTVANGPGGLNSFVRIFNSQGQQIALNDNALAPGEGSLGFDAYLRHTFNVGGTYFIGISNATNTTYNANDGGGDIAGGPNATGAYQLNFRTVLAQPNGSFTSSSGEGSLRAEGEAGPNSFASLRNSMGSAANVGASTALGNVANASNIAATANNTLAFRSSRPALVLQSKQAWAGAVDQFFAQESNNGKLAGVQRLRSLRWR